MGCGGMLQANEKPAPPGLLSTIIQAWQALSESPVHPSPLARACGLHIALTP